MLYPHLCAPKFVRPCSRTSVHRVGRCSQTSVHLHQAWDLVAHQMDQLWTAAFWLWDATSPLAKQLVGCLYGAPPSMPACCSFSTEVTPRSRVEDSLPGNPRTASIGYELLGLYEPTVVATTTWCGTGGPRACDPCHAGTHHAAGCPGRPSGQFVVHVAYDTEAGYVF